MTPTCEGTLRLDKSRPAPWQYTGFIRVPSGRFASLEAKVGEDSAGRFFDLRVGMTPGMSAAELEAVMVATEKGHAARVRVEMSETDELPF